MYCYACGAKLIDGARFCYECGTAVPEFLLKKEAGSAEPAPAPRPAPAPQPAPQPVYRPEPAPGPVPEPQPVYRPEPAPAPQPAPERAFAEPASDAPDFQIKKFHVEFQLVSGEQFKTGFHLEDEGYVEVTPTALSLYKKSRGVSFAFGLIGNAIEGKGKFVETFPRSKVESYEKLRNKNPGVAAGYKVRFTDGRSLKFTFISITPYRDGDENVSAIDGFLTQKKGVTV
jgi:hypothetical protein